MNNFFVDFNKNEIIFPTALASINILDSLNINLSEKNIVVAGQGMLVGKPVTHILKNRGYKVEVITRKTPARPHEGSGAGGENKEDLFKKEFIQLFFRLRVII